MYAVPFYPFTGHFWLKNSVCSPFLSVVREPL
jgi:hypothetical protein